MRILDHFWHVEKSLKIAYLGLKKRFKLVLSFIGRIILEKIDFQKNSQKWPKSNNKLITSTFYLRTLNDWIILEFFQSGESGYWCNRLLMEFIFLNIISRLLLKRSLSFHSWLLSPLAQCWHLNTWRRRRIKLTKKLLKCITERDMKKLARYAG